MELITSIKLLILKRSQAGQLSPSSPDQSFEAVFDQMIANKYSKTIDERIHHHTGFFFYP